MVAAGLVAGLVTGGFPGELATVVPQLALIAAMTFSLTEISFRGISLRAEARGILLALAMSYGALGGLVLVYAALTAQPDVRSGWVLMAAVPPAVLIVPLSSFLRGDVRGSLIAEAVLYLLGLVTVPGLCLVLLGATVSVDELVAQTLLLIGVPIIVSRPARKWPRMPEARPTLVSGSFFVLVLAIAGSARGVLFEHPDLLTTLSAMALLRTFGLGLLLFALLRGPRTSRDRRISVVTFASFKNLGLTVVLASTLFSPAASLPAVVSLVFEILWLGTLPFLFRVPRGGVAGLTR